MATKHPRCSSVRFVVVVALISCLPTRLVVGGGATEDDMNALQQPMTIVYPIQ